MPSRKPKKKDKPLEAIPADFKCPYAECAEDDPWPDEQAFRGHMAGKHNVTYESRYEHNKRVELAKMRDKAPEARERETLLPWHMMAIAKKELYNLTWQEIADEMRNGKGSATMSQVYNSPAGVRYREELQEHLADIPTMVKTMMDSATLQMYIDWMQAFEWAKDARDYKQIHTMAKDVGLKKVVEEDQQQGPRTIVLNLSANDLAQGEVKSSAKMITVEEDDIEFEEE